MVKTEINLVLKILGPKWFDSKNDGYNRILPKRILLSRKKLGPKIPDPKSVGSKKVLLKKHFWSEKIWPQIF